ncbi:hypothetical protein RvVAR0630_38930 [Agrobacterium vitis]|uniref:hypothetical protein n=1 Tax=Agrobacterium vitis TaxID=373 RepID=UPI0015DCE6E2|nr:hypothetical protein [Agrobacterium vitis]BCH61269.1 hypothetical protein RvVAR0630_38930 [Agrobacterium vitis]
MFTRTKTRIVHFKCPFTFPGLEGTQPAGDYQVKDDEEQITGIFWLAYRRVATLIEIAKGSTTSLVAIDNLDLDATIEKDRATSITATGYPRQVQEEPERYLLLTPSQAPSPGTSRQSTHRRRRSEGKL